MIELTGEHLTIEGLAAIAREKVKVRWSEEAHERVEKSREVVEKIVREKRTVYGINTGFGKLSDVRIEECDVDRLQVNLLMSHACGVGEPLPCDIVRAMMALRVNALIKGYSGIRLETIEQMITYLNADIVPVVYAQGSLGASGDLVPLAHMALPLIGMGEVRYKGEVMETGKALKMANIEPIDALHAKEGLALINGTQAMTAVLALALYDSLYLLSVANKNAALVFEALRGIVDALDERVHRARNQPGQIQMANTLLDLLEGSANVTRQAEIRIQDAYALRCTPQVHGATWDALKHVRVVVEREMNAVTDNPVVLDDGEAISAGNFHGQPIALVADYLAVAMAELANISERRLERIVNPHLNEGLPPFLVQEKGLHSGFMIVQYAAASLVSENKSLAHPASVDSIPSSGNQEDHVSMGTIAARQAMQIVTHTKEVLAMELMTAAQALDFRGSIGLSPANKSTYDAVRKHVPFVDKDRIMRPLIEASIEMITRREI